MRTSLQVLSDEERGQIHERSLKLLAATGLRVDTPRGRKMLGSAGARVDEDNHRVRLPPSMVEECLRLAPRQFTLGGRRPGWSLPANAHRCALITDGGGIFTLDAQTNQRRRATQDDWLLATRLSDAIDEFGCFWNAVSGIFEETPAGTVDYWRKIFQNYSKHIQEATATPVQTRWMLEVMEAVFGGKESIRQGHPVSFLLCPSSPLVMEEHYTDAYLETLGWGIPLAVMTMPLMGMSGPGTLISNLVLANCETLAFLCLAQTAEPGIPFLYAPIPAVADPHFGRFGSGEVEHSLFGAAVAEMARYYNLPAEVSTGGSDHHIPGIQSGYERALNFILPILSQPDLLVGPGLLGGSMIFSPEQLMIDLEIIRRCRRLSQGIASDPEEWLEEVIDRVGPGGNFMSQKSTRRAYHSGEVYISTFGCHQPFELWQEGSGRGLLDEARDQIAQTLAGYAPLPLDDTVERELDKIAQRARQSNE
jgi:trimethylamine--corrinoid protein Co-methyltransferase